MPNSAYDLGPNGPSLHPAIPDGFFEVTPPRVREAGQNGRMFRFRV
jgi:hypothetical protein